MIDSLNALVVIANFVLVPGLAYGSQLALGALGVTMVYSVLRFSNFAHGELMSFGAMITVLLTWWLQAQDIGLGVLPTALLAIPVAMLVTIGLALVTDKLVFSYYRQKRAETVTYLIVSVGVMFTIGGLIRFIIGPADRVFTDGQRFLLKARAFKKMTGLNEGLAIKTTQGVTILVAVVVVALIFWFLNKTKTGKSMRAYSDNEDLALLSGINPERVVMITWIITGALAASRGALGWTKAINPLPISRCCCLSLLLPLSAGWAIRSGQSRAV